MVRGIFTGVIWGGVVSFGLVSVANAVFDVVTPEQISRAAQGAVLEADQGANQRADQAAEHAVEKEPAPAADQTSVPAEEQAPPAEEAPAEETPAMDADPADATETGADTMDAAPGAMPSEEATSGETPTVADPATPVETAPETSEPALDAPEVGQLPGLETPDAPGAGTLPETTPSNTPDAMPGEDPVLAPPLPQSPESPAPDRAPQADTRTPNNSPNNSKTIKVGEPQDAGAQGTDEQKDTQMAVIDDDLSTPNDAADPAAQSGIGEKVGSFTDRADDRLSTRLPTVAPQGAGTETAPTVSAEDLPALLAHSANYTAAPAGPILSVILVDIGAIPADDPSLRNLPFPVALAVDALAPGADERAFSYRNADLEVLSMVALPEGATPQDVAVSFSQAREVVPVSIGFLDIPSAAFQNSREVAKQVIASAQEEGHGVVSFPLGLNALQAEAQRAKAPAGFIFRDFDGRGQDVSAMKRFLDQAAFRAGVEGKIVMLARAKPDTLQAMAEWSLGNRAKSVSIVPLSYLLSREDE